MEGSERQSETPGHIAAAVYEIKKSRTVVLGIYGISESNDRLSSSLIREASNIIEYNSGTQAALQHATRPCSRGL
jgi:hypothetical protein